MANNESESSQLGHYKGVMLCNRPYGGTGNNFLNFQLKILKIIL